MSNAQDPGIVPDTAVSHGTAASIAEGVLMAATVWRAVGGPASLAWVMAVAAAVLIAAEYRSIPERLRRTSIFLFAASIVLLPFAQSPLQAIQRGIFVFGLLMALMGSIMLLARCALRSGQVRFIGESLRAMPPGRRYLSFTLAGQLFSGMLGLAGTNIMLVMASPNAGAPDPQRLISVVATMRGFSAAIFWSPMLGNMAILLALYPGLRWAEVLPVGVVAALITVITGVLMNRAAGGAGAAAAAEPAPPGRLLQALLPLFALLGIFAVLIIATSNLLGSGISASIVLLAPLAALFLNAVMGDPGSRLASGLRNMRGDIRQFPKLASEALLFAAAGCAGSIMAAAFPASWVDHISHALSGIPFFAIAFLMCSIMLMSLVGIHPVLSSVFLSSTLTPEVMALPALVHFQAILIGWGLTACLTPFSAMSMMASRYSGAGLYEISVGRNWLFALVNAMMACLLLTALVPMLRN